MTKQMPEWMAEIKQTPPKRYRDQLHSVKVPTTIMSEIDVEHLPAPLLPLRAVADHILGMAFYVGESKEEYLRRALKIIDDCVLDLEQADANIRAALGEREDAQSPLHP